MVRAERLLVRHRRRRWGCEVTDGEAINMGPHSAAAGSRTSSRSGYLYYARPFTYGKRVRKTCISLRCKLIDGLSSKLLA